MEERIIDKEREIKLKRTKTGNDAVEADAEAVEEETEELEEVVLDVPEEETDEDLIGLTPSQLKEELERRRREQERAQKEYERLTEAGAERLKEGDYKGAEDMYAQAMLYGAEAETGYWQARTRDFTDGSCFYEPATSEAFSEAGEETRAAVLSRLGEGLREEKAALEEEIAPLKSRYEEAAGERREAFLANRKYWLTRLYIALAAMLAFCGGAVVCVAMLSRVKGNSPLIALGVLAGLAVVALVFLIYFARKCFVAQKLVSLNEKPSSTEDGARLAALQTKYEGICTALAE